MTEIGERETQDNQGHGPVAAAAGPSPGRPPTALRPVAAVAAVTAAIHLSVATRYGWHNDEFYYVICGRHPAWGYVDQPPLTPLLARLAAALPGGVLPLRLLAIAAQVGCVLLTAVLAAELGGRRRAQVIAAAAVAACPVFVAASMLFGTTVTDQLAWVALLVLVARALRLRSTRAWLLAGAVAGIGLENKDTVAVLLLGIAVSLALFRRDVLRTPGPWLASGLAVVIAAPNLVWDARHQWVNFQMARVLSGEQGGVLGSLAQLPGLVLLLAGLPIIALWIIGIRWLASPAGRDHRWVLGVAAVAVMVFTASGGKSYYPAPALAGLFAAGAVRIEAARVGAVRIEAALIEATQVEAVPIEAARIDAVRVDTPEAARGRRHRGWRWPVAIGLSALISVFVGLPVLPPSAATALRKVNPELMQTYGWPQFVSEVARAAKTVPPGTPVFTSDYGEAGALTILGPTQGFNPPIYSGHNNYTLWGPPPGTPDTVLCLGVWDDAIAYLHRFWSQVTEIAPITLPGGLLNNDVAGHDTIYLCRKPHGTWAQMWPAMRHLD